MLHSFIQKIKLFSNKIIVDTDWWNKIETSNNHFLRSVKRNASSYFPTRMFQSVSGHNSKKRRAHQSSLPTVLLIQGVADTITKWFKNHQSQRSQISTVGNAPFIQNSNRDRNPKFFERIISTPVIFKATSKLFGSQGSSDDKNWLDFSSIFFNISRFGS